MSATDLAPAPATATAAVECRDLSAGYGRLTVVRHVDLSIRPGEVVALLGPNGAGKTTLLNCLAGFVDRHDGDVLLDGESLPSGRAATAARRGIALVADDRALFTKLTLAENLEVARRRGSPDARSVLERFPALEKRWDVLAGNLSGGEQQMLAVARALLREPKVLLVDEMSMGLAPMVVEDLMPVVRRVADELGTAVLLVEQHVRLALEVADRAVVLVHGQVRLEGTSATLAADPERLEAASLGAEAPGPTEPPITSDDPKEIR